LQIFESTGWLLEEPAINDDTKYDLIIPTIVKPPFGNKNPSALEVFLVNELTVFSPFDMKSDKIFV